MTLRYQPDMLLLDVQMPVKTGLDVMKEVEKAGLAPITVILRIMRSRTKSGSTMKNISPMY